MLPHHHRSGPSQPELHAVGGPCATNERRWLRRLALAVLVLPLSVPFFILYLVLAAPLVLFAALITRRNMCRFGLRPLRAAPMEMFWFPFWRLCTKNGRQRCEYVDMSTTQARPRPIRCPADALPTKPPNTARLVLISDTHGKHDWVDVPNGDVLCHTGDITVGWQNRLCCCRSVATLKAFDAWLGDLPHRHKVVIGGNHDALLEKLVSQGHSVCGQGIGCSESARPFVNATYLENSGKILQLSNGSTLHVWGTPWSPPGRSKNQAFRAASTGQINPPTGVDVLLSHSKLSPEILERVRPRVHASGHLHGNHGVNFVDGQRQPAHLKLSDQAADAYKSPTPFAPPPCQSRRLEVNCAVSDINCSTTQRVVVVDLPMSDLEAASTGVATTTTETNHWKSMGKLLSRITG